VQLLSKNFSFVGPCLGTSKLIANDFSKFKALGTSSSKRSVQLLKKRKATHPDEKHASVIVKAEQSFKVEGRNESEQQQAAGRLGGRL
jgi:hypothetical protein